MISDFQPNFKNILKVLYNKKPRRLPLYEHHIDVPFISKYLNEEIFLQGNRSIDLIHQQAKKILLHSCGKIFEIMDDLIDLGIDAKHSNEDEIAPYEKWIELYSHKIGLFGGIDMNILSLNSYDDVCKIVLEKAANIVA